MSGNGAAPRPPGVLPGVPRALPAAVLGAITIVGGLWALETQYYLGLTVFKEQFLAVMLGLGLAGTFVSARSSGQGGGAVPWYDWLFAAASVIVAGYVALDYATLVHDLSSLAAERWLLGAAALALVLEATRRLLGNALVLLAALFILYARFADSFPGVLNAPSSAWERIAVYLYLDTSGLFGIPLDVAAQTIVSFVLFGNVLKAVRGDRFITDLALMAMGRFRGGPAKVSVLASSLFGTVSGSAVSNVAVVGPITIPMMRQVGFAPHVAGAIEAVASTGGQIMPPVMGITAFLIADFLSIPYGEVVIAALVPALLYYLAVFVQVDAEAARLGLVGLARERLPRLGPVLSVGYVFIVPLAVLIYAVVIADWQPGRAGMAAAGAALAAGCMRRSTRPSLRALWEACVATGRIMLDMLVATGAAGIIIGALQLSGLSFGFSNVVLAAAGENVLSILLITGAVCVILGMALPTAVIYLTLAVLVAPALTQLGVDPLAAHLFLFYMGMLSMITPPVCLATFTAAAIAGANFWRTGLHGMRFGVVAYVVPFVFAFSPGLLMKGGTLTVTVAVATAAVGVVLLAWGLTGHVMRHLGPVERSVLVACGLAILPSPSSGTIALWSNVIGIAIGALTLALVWRSLRRAAPAGAGGR